MPSRAESRFISDFGWLDSKHSFSFGHHYEPANTHHGLLLVNNDDIVDSKTTNEDDSNMANCYRYRQDEDPSTPHRAALGTGRAGLRGGHQGRPQRPRHAGRGHRSRRPAGPRTSGWEWKAAGRPGRVREPPGKLGVQLRATVSSFGPLLLGKTLVAQRDPDQRAHAWSSSTATTASCRCSISPTSAPCSSTSSSDEGKPALAQYGGMSGATVGVLLRKMIELESQGADRFFGEPEFDVKDLMQLTSDGRGVVTVSRAERRAGQAAPLVDLHDVAAGRAVSQPARGRRPAQAQARLLLRRGAPALRATPRRRFSTRCSRSCG